MTGLADVLLLSGGGQLHPVLQALATESETAVLARLLAIEQGERAGAVVAIHFSLPACLRSRYQCSEDKCDLKSDSVMNTRPPDQACSAVAPLGRSGASVNTQLLCGGINKSSTFGVTSLSRRISCC